MTNLPGTNITAVTVTGTYTDFAGVPIQGTVTFTATPTAMTDAGSNMTFMPKPVTVPITSGGAISVTLAATDDPDGNPVGFTYTVTENFDGGRTYAIALPAATSPVDLADVSPESSESGGAAVWAGVPLGGEIGQTLVKTGTADYDTGWSSDFAQLDDVGAGRLLGKLALAESDATLCLIGDSTANDGDEWLRVALPSLAAEYPGWTVRHRLWNHSTQSYDAPDTVQTGAPGLDPEPILVDTFTRTGALSGSTADTGQTWAAATGVQADGTRAVVGSTTGSALAPTVSGDCEVTWTITATTSNAALQVTDHWLWLRTQSSGLNEVFASLVLYPGYAGISILKRIAGSASTVASLVDTLAPPIVLNSGTPQTFTITGRIEGTETTWLLNGEEVISGSLTSGDVAALSSSDLVGMQFQSTVGSAFAYDSITVSSVQPTRTLDVYNASQPGAAVGYFTDERIDIAVPVRPDLVVFSLGHNHAAEDADTYVPPLEDLVDRVLALHPQSESTPPPGVAVSSQNPQKYPAPYADAHLSRFVGLRAMCARRGWDYIAVVEQFLAQPDPYSLVQSDGFHPTVEGSVLWGELFLGWLHRRLDTQLTVTGSRGGNAALASLLTALAGLGLITDSTS